MPLPPVKAAYGVVDYRTPGTQTPGSFSLVRFFPLVMPILAPFMVAPPVSGNGRRNKRQRKSNRHGEHLLADIVHGSAEKTMNSYDGS